MARRKRPNISAKSRVYHEDRVYPVRPVRRQRSWIDLALVGALGLSLGIALLGRRV